MKKLITILSLTVAIQANGFAQAHKNLARVTVLSPKEGSERQFEDGYKRHLEWHIKNGDTWNWYGWSVVSGKRLGYFVDATFGHSWADFDIPINPAADRADFDSNLGPFANVVTQFVCAALPAQSMATGSGLSASLLQVVYLRVRPGQEKTFEEFLTAFRRDYPKIAPNQNFYWYRIEDGDQLPQYFLLLPSKSNAERQNGEGFWAKLWAQSAEAQTKFQNSVSEMNSETMLYRADMTFIPKQ